MKLKVDRILFVGCLIVIALNVQIIQLAPCIMVQFLASIVSNLLIVLMVTYEYIKGMDKP